MLISFLFRPHVLTLAAMASAAVSVQAQDATFIAPGQRLSSTATLPAGDAFFTPRSGRSSEDDRLLAQGLSLAHDAVLDHSYFMLAPASSGPSGQQVGEVKLKFGLLAPQETLLHLSGVKPPSEAGLVELSRSFGTAALALSVSQANTSNIHLGPYSQSVPSLGEKTSTSTVQLSGTMLLGPKMALAGSAAYGVTPGLASGSVSGTGLGGDLAHARSNAFSLALVASDRVKAGDRLSVSVSQPMRAHASRMVMDMLTGRSGSTRLANERLVFTMVPLGREMRAQLNYFTPLPQQASFRLTLMVRREPNDLADASTEKLLLLRYAKQF